MINYRFNTVFGGYIMKLTEAANFTIKKPSASRRERSEHDLKT